MYEVVNFAVVIFIRGCGTSKRVLYEVVNFTVAIFGRGCHTSKRVLYEVVNFTVAIFGRGCVTLKRVLYAVVNSPSFQGLELANNEVPNLKTFSLDLLALALYEMV